MRSILLNLHFEARLVKIKLKKNVSRFFFKRNFHAWSEKFLKNIYIENKFLKMTFLSKVGKINFYK